jgi:acyl-CoA thioesterase-1
MPTREDGERMSWRLTRILRFLAALLAVAALVHAGVAEAAPIRIVAFGDSNTAGFGVAVKSAYPFILQRILRAKGYDVVVKNSGMNGDTSAGGLARLSSGVPTGTQFAIVFFGRNDVRFGLPVSATRRNLNAIVTRLRARKVQVILCGYYQFSFSGIAAAHGALYAGDFFAGTAVKGIKKGKYVLSNSLVPHLNPAGYSVVARHLAPLVEQAVLRTR